MSNVLILLDETHTLCKGLDRKVAELAASIQQLFDLVTDGKELLLGLIQFFNDLLALMCDLLSSPSSLVILRNHFDRPVIRGEEVVCLRAPFCDFAASRIHIHKLRPRGIDQMEPRGTKHISNLTPKSPWAGQKLTA